MAQWKMKADETQRGGLNWGKMGQAKEEAEGEKHRRGEVGLKRSRLNAAIGIRGTGHDGEKGIDQL